MSLVGGRNTLTEYMFCRLFYENTNLVNAENLILPNNVANSCYSAMFYKCYSLTTAPALPATNLASWCYCSMFKECTSLTTAPALPATNLAEGCYANMFWGCNALKTAPALPATTLAEDCYCAMFYGCTSLTDPHYSNTMEQTYCESIFCGTNIDPNNYPEYYFYIESLPEEVGKKKHKKLKGMLLKAFLFFDIFSIFIYPK